MSVNCNGPAGSRWVVDQVGGGELITVIHGSSGVLASWDLVAAELCDSFTIITYTRASEAPSLGCSGPEGSVHATAPDASTEHVMLQRQSHVATHTAPQQFAAELRTSLRRHPASP